MIVDCVRILSWDGRAGWNLSLPNGLSSGTMKTLWIWKIGPGTDETEISGLHRVLQSCFSSFAIRVILM